jgi:hypothetical protein
VVHRRAVQRIGSELIGAPDEAFLIGIRKRPAALRTDFVNGAAVVVAQEWTGNRLHQECAGPFPAGSQVSVDDFLPGQLPVSGDALDVCFVQARRHRFAAVGAARAIDPDERLRSAAAGHDQGEQPKQWQADEALEIRTDHWLRP